VERNRHGIPVYTPGPIRCVWPGCRADKWRDLQVCFPHAEQCGNAVLDLLEAAKSPEPVKEPSPRDGWIYYVRTDGHYKIGFATNVRARMRAYPPTSVLLAQHRGTMADEKAIHSRFAAHRVAGREWFRMDDEITRYIEAVVSMHGRCVNTFEERTAQRPESGRLRSKTRRMRTFTV
jgi:hypothetical protein